MAGDVEQAAAAADFGRRGRRAGERSVGRSPPRWTIRTMRCVSLRLGLAAGVESADAAAVTPLLPSVCMRCRAAIDNDAKGVSLPSAGFSLFAELARLRPSCRRSAFPCGAHALPAALTYPNHDEPNLSAAAAALAALARRSASTPSQTAATTRRRRARARASSSIASRPACQAAQSGLLRRRPRRAARSPRNAGAGEGGRRPAARTHTCALLASALGRRAVGARDGGARCCARESRRE